MNRTFIKQVGGNVLLALCALPVGAVIGLITGIFGRGLALVVGIRSINPYYFIPFLFAGGLLIVWMNQRFGGENGQKGIGLVFEVDQDRQEKLPLRMVILSIVSTWITHLFGGSAGREGVAVLVGADCGHWFGRRLPGKDAQRIFLVVGMAAGFAGLFRTPIASALFAVEVLAAGNVRYRAMLPSVAAAFMADWISGLLGLECEHIVLTASLTLSFTVIVRILIMGIAFGLAGLLFAVGMHTCKKYAARYLKNPYIRVAVMGLGISALLMLSKGRYIGFGTNLIEAAVSGGKVYVFDWFLKGMFTILTLSAGFQGGEVTTLFTVGATLGAVLASAFGLPVELGAAMGYTAVFCSGTNTFFGPLFLGAQVFGYEYMPFLFISCVTAYLFNGNKSIYHQQLIIEETLFQA